MTATRIVSTGLLALLASAPLAACRAAEDRDKVAFLLATMQEERYQKDKRYFEERAKELGLSVIVEAAGNDDSRQLGQVEDVLARGAKVIVIQPTDSAAASPYVRIAHRYGARMIAYDRAIYSKELDFYVSHDSYQVGVLQAQAALTATEGKGNYVILSGQSGHSVASEITRGYRETLQPYLDRGDVRIVLEQSHDAWSPEQSLRSVNTAIARTGGKLAAILANNSGLARGAVEAITTANLDNVFIAGADADAANVNFVCEGKQSVEVLKDIKPLAHRAAEVAAALINDESLPRGSTIELGGGAVPLAAVRVGLVTPSTVKELLIDSGFFARTELPACAGTRN